MQDEAYFVAKLTLRHIKPTATRLLIVREMMRGDETVSLPELERLLPTIDKSTISRTLSLFLLHSTRTFIANIATARSVLNNWRCRWCRYPTAFG